MMRRVTKPRAVGLAALSVGCIIRGLAYLLDTGGSAGPRVNGVVIVLTADGHIPITIHAVAWIAAGLVAAWAAIRGRWAHTASDIIGGLCFAWGLAYLIAWWAGLDPRGWISAGTYLSFGVTILAWTHLEDPIRRTKE